MKLSDDPERTVTIPVSNSNGTGTSSSDYSGVPSDVTFNSGDTEKTFSFSATQDTDDESEETVMLGFGDMPSGVSAGTPAQATVYIRDSLRVPSTRRNMKPPRAGPELRSPSNWTAPPPQTS